MRLERIMVAATAVIAIAFTSAAGAALVHLWRHPTRLGVEYTSDGMLWRGSAFSAELQARDGAFEQLTVWRNLQSPEQLVSISAKASH